MDELGNPHWISALATGDDHNHVVHAVRDLEPAEALELLGVDRTDIRPCELPDQPAELARAAVRPLNPSAVLIAGRAGDWTFVYDDFGVTGWLSHLAERPPPEAAKVLSGKGSAAATSHVSITGNTGFTYATGGEILVDVSDKPFERSDLLEEPPAEIRAALDAAGSFDIEYDDGLPMRMICALAGLPRTLDELRRIPLLIAPLES
ncbi:hypothetical protein [Amycolatopsis minnesotensis]|uniref:Uncharacterized protein n=1 Tax=Amycolatopsis minnesotensis TaxID=337894 RepID=A0ABN2RGR8_9PSEU